PCISVCRGDRVHIRVFMPYYIYWPWHDTDPLFSLYYASTAKQCQTRCLLLTIANNIPTISSATRRPIPRIRMKDNPDVPVPPVVPVVPVDTGGVGVIETVPVSFEVGNTTNGLGGG